MDADLVPIGRLDDGGALVYAEPGRPEYWRYGHAGVAVLDAAALRQVA